jgi:penicillin-binding protein 2
VEKASSRLRVLALLVVMMFLALSTRLWFLQVLAVDRFADDARRNSVRFVYSDPLRGKIYDASGDAIVENRGSLEVRVMRSELGQQGESVILRLSEVLDMEVRELTRRLQNKRYYPYQAIPVASFVDEEVAFYLSEHQDEFPGVSVVPASVRSYPHGRLAAHMLGYVGLIQAEDYERLKDKGYGQNDLIGRAGLEVVYEKHLRGQKGVQKFIVNSDGETIRALGAKQPTPGADLRLTIELDTQRIAEEELRAGLDAARLRRDSSGRPLRATAGVVIVMDADTGGLRAMASLPSFDPSWYVEGLTNVQRNYLNDDGSAPNLNRAIQLGYVPGSTYKPITALAAVKEGIASLSGYYPCTTEYVHPGDTSGAVFTNWEPSNTTMSIAEALRVSCDTVFYKFGSEFYYRFVQNQLGEKGQLLQRALREWGYGTPTGIDLPGEAGGLVPDAAWAETRPDLFEYGWSPGGDILTMIGSSYVTATPLQIAQSYAAIANGGHLCRPHVVDQVVAPDGTVVKDPPDRCDRTIPYSPQQLQYIRTALSTVTTSGTAFCAFNGFPLSQIPVAGKTGTAERGSPDFQDTSWFAAMVGPVSDPDYVVITMVEQGGFGGQVAAPITRSIIERIEGVEDSPRRGCAVVEADG